MENTSTVFITGTGRSGTNVTKAIFARHSECATLPFEYRFTVDPGGLIDFLNHYSCTWSPFMADKRLRSLESYLTALASIDESEYKASKWLRKVDPRSERITPHSYAGWELEKCFPGYKHFVKTLMNQLVDYKYSASWPGSDSLSEKNQMYFGAPKTKDELIPIFGAFLNSCFQSYLIKTNKSCFVEDNTWSLLYADDLLSMVPEGKILHIVRDPRDVVSSLMKQRWTPSDIDQIIAWYRSIIARWQMKKRKLQANQFLEIKLEDITSNPADTIKKMCVFTGLEYETAMTDLDLSKSNSGRYKTELSKEEINKVESLLRDVIKDYNY